jgi:hypothetical protein
MGTGFTGPHGTFNFLPPPPDPNASVGDMQIVETVNVFMSIFDKSTGTPVLGPILLAALWNGFNSQCAGQGNGLADPIVLYDKQAGRWLIRDVTLTSPYTTCFAVSKTSDALGSYNLYAFQQPGVGSLTGQKLGIWPDAYYMAQWTFPTVTSYTGPQACALDRTQMLAGQTATMQCFQVNNTNVRGMAPADLDGSNLPPSGAPNYFVLQAPAGTNALYMYKFHVDFTTPSNSTFTGPTTIMVAPYRSASPDSVVSIPQPGTSQLLDANGSDIMPRVAYRYFPAATPAHESLVATHSVMVGSGSSARVGVRWYELRDPSSAVTLYQQGTYSPDTTSRWMGSIAMDKTGDIAVGYTAGSSTLSPSMRYTGRVPSDALDTMESEATIFTGTGAQTGSGRWGDYTSMSVDPSDDCTFWHVGQYMTGTGSKNWATRVFSFKFPSCN